MHRSISASNLWSARCFKGEILWLLLRVPEDVEKRFPSTFTRTAPTVRRLGIDQWVCDDCMMRDMTEAEGDAHHASTGHFGSQQVGPTYLEVDMSVTIHISVEEMAKHEAQLRAEMISELRPWMKHYMACKGYGGLFQRGGEIVTDCTCGLSVKLEPLSQVKTPDLEPERDMHWKKRAYDTLAQFGVPFERAKSISNGIRVLATRYEKEIASLRASLEGKHCLCTFDKDGTHLNDCPLHGSIDRSAEQLVHSATCPRCFLSFTCTGGYDE